MSKKKDVDVTADDASLGAQEVSVTSAGPKAVPEPIPAPPEPTPIDEVSKVIAGIQSAPGYVHQSAEHLEVLAMRKLQELGWDLRRAEVAVRSRLY